MRSATPAWSWAVRAASPASGKDGEEASVGGGRPGPDGGGAEVEAGAARVADLLVDLVDLVVVEGWNSSRTSGGRC